VPAAIVRASSGAKADSSSGAVEVAAHPINAGVDWDAAKPQATAAPLGTGWKPIVSVDKKPIIAIRESPRRQVLISFDAPDFSRTLDFVILWTNVFDWLGGGAGDASSHWVSTVAPPPELDPSTGANTQPQTASHNHPKTRKTDVTSAVLLSSLACLVLAALAWPGRCLTAFSAPRTV
jgi:hypothetical protein